MLQWLQVHKIYVTKLAMYYCVQLEDTKLITTIRYIKDQPVTQEMVVLVCRDSLNASSAFLEFPSYCRRRKKQCRSLARIARNLQNNSIIIQYNYIKDNTCEMEKIIGCSIFGLAFKFFVHILVNTLSHTFKLKVAINMFFLKNLATRIKNK